MSDPLFWSLVYADGTTVTEPVENATIRGARPHAIALLAVTPDGKEMFKIPLLGDDGWWRPIWYRRRAIEPDDRGPVLIETVFGRARVRRDEIVGTLYLAIGDTIVDCPPGHYEKSMIELQIAAN